MVLLPMDNAWKRSFIDQSVKRDPTANGLQAYCLSSFAYTQQGDPFLAQSSDLPNIFQV